MTTAGNAAPPSDARRFSVEQAMAAASAVLLPLGLIMILLGWYGAAHTPYLFEQVPYLISGGILGLGFALVGGLVYFGSWLARGAAEQQRRTEEMTELLREVRDELRSGGLTAAAPARRTRSSSNGKRHGAEPFVATARGGMLHRPDCAVVAGRQDLRPIGAGGDGLAPCALCNPFDADVLTP
jgi:hypothetical protein